MRTVDVVQISEELDTLLRPYLIHYNSATEPVYDYGIGGLIDTYFDNWGIRHHLHEIELDEERGIFVISWFTSYYDWTLHFFYHKEANTIG